MTTQEQAAPHPLIDGRPPTWARQWGEDDFGVFVGIGLGDAEQRFRWIPPGRFWMGSPSDEVGRDRDEGPRHLVTLTEGFWLADTPCAQALWQEVMGTNPSRFRSTLRPVEQVSWEDCQVFLEKLNQRIEGLQAILPTEAQWEWACRAGTETATWRGDLKILGHNNAPGLNEIAWYGGNSGVDFDLEEGEDSSGWPQKQFPHLKAGTRKVATKEANPWGLYDMLGNVYEWCADWKGDYGADPVEDPVGPEEGVLRVIRGSSWSGHARFVRAAYRDWSRAGNRDGGLGFRLALGGGLGRGAASEGIRGAD